MTSLLATDGAMFTGLVEKIEGHATASFRVTMDRGSDPKVENDSMVFANEVEATAWIEREAQLRGFRNYLLSLKYPPSHVRSPLAPDMIGLQQRWRL